ncbi:MAG: polysaccharide export protein [Verrucomicrobia bacterium]|nr:polysaccharide export protein [Verrucomicrobiota bacterium]
MIMQNDWSWLRCAGLLLGVWVCGTVNGAETIETDRQVAPADTLTIVVLGEKDLQLELRVEASGTIKFPLLGEVPVSGKTTVEVARLLEEKLDKDFLVNPQVTINVKEYRSATVSVIGKVGKAGAIPLPSERAMDILEAIAESGGFEPTANKNKIELTRKGKTFTFKFDELRKVTDQGKKVWVEPGDVIYVPESFF